LVGGGVGGFVGAAVVGLGVGAAVVGFGVGFGVGQSSQAKSGDAVLLLPFLLNFLDLNTLLTLSLT
jgi:hypothetical protein